MPALVWTDTEEKSAVCKEQALLLPWHKRMVDAVLVSSKAFQFLEQDFAGKAVANENRPCELPT